MPQFTYYAPNLANRIPNVFYILGVDSVRETYTSTAVYNYRRENGATWSSVRDSLTGVVSNGIEINNGLTLGEYTLTRTGVQFSTTWGIVPVGIEIQFFLDTFTLPEGQSLKIQAFKGASTALTGISSEYTIPLDQGLVPYSNEIEIDGISSESTSPILYFNQTAINDFIANPDQNLFILGEYDYNNIAPTDRYAAGDSQGSNVGLTGQT
jgi:hypothetical protein